MKPAWRPWRNGKGRSSNLNSRTFTGAAISPNIPAAWSVSGCRSLARRRFRSNNWHPPGKRLLSLANENNRTPMKHTRPVHLLQRRAIRVVVIGCGGYGSVMVMGLPYIHQALLLAGHPGGLHVTLIDGDVVSPSNCVRQPFGQSEIGLSKSVVLTSRINLFWGLQWKAIQEHVSKSQKVEEADIVISCVDTRSARASIDKLVGGNASVTYWLDLGNGADGGQFVLG